MKKHIMYRIAISIIFSLSIFLTTGCGEQAESPNDMPALVIIAGTHSNSQEIDTDILIREIEDVYSHFGNVGVIVSDGTPTVEYDQNRIMLGFCDEKDIEKSIQRKNDNEKYWQNVYLNKLMSDLSKGLNELKPSDDEVDTLRAIEEAKLVINDLVKDNTKTKKLVIYDTGLCTSGELSFLNEDLSKLLFSDNIPQEAIDVLIDGLDSQRLIPDLSGIQVTWYGLGAVAGEQGVQGEQGKQSKLSRSSVENLKTIWAAILKAANALPSDNKQAEDGYFVPTKTMPKAQYDKIVTPVTPPPADNTEPTESTTNLGDELRLENVEFEDNEAIFVSEQTARNILASYADMLKTNPDRTVILVGTTADPKKNGGDKNLSEERAKKVKGILCELGVSEDRFEDVIGWGANEPLYIAAEWDGDQFIDEIAKKNRTVWIIWADSDLAQEILKIRNQ